jgi:hypothetical protein
MVDDTILYHVEKNIFSVKVKSTRASKRHAKEVSAAVAERTHPNVNTQGVPIFASGEDSVLSTGLKTKVQMAHQGCDPMFIPGAKGWTLLAPWG